jgi:SAM-dependent methyltransferase
MPQIGTFDTDTPALVQRVQSHKKFGTAELNDWIFENTNPVSGSKVLDLGCGFGKQTLAMLEKGCTVVAVDASKESLSQLEKSAEEMTSALTTINSTFDDLIVPDIEFDCIISSYAFYYSQDAAAVLAKVSKKLKTGGTIFICGPAYRNNQGIKNLLMKVGVTFGEGSAPFMEKEGPQLFEHQFGNVETTYFENDIVFPNAEEVWKYWSSHNMFDASIENQFKSELAAHFEVNETFVTTKVAIGLRSTKR